MLERLRYTLPILCLLLLQLAMVHGAQHDANLYDGAPTQSVHSETDCLLGDTATALAPSGPPEFQAPLSLLAGSNLGLAQVYKAKYLTPFSRAPPQYL